MRDFIPFYTDDRLIEQIAFSLWKFDVEDMGSPHTFWAQVKDEYLSRARFVTEELDRLEA